MIGKFSTPRIAVGTELKVMNMVVRVEIVTVMDVIRSVEEEVVVKVVLAVALVVGERETEEAVTNADNQDI